MKKHTALSLIYKFAHENRLNVEFKGKYPFGDIGIFVVYDSEGNYILEFSTEHIWLISYKFDFSGYSYFEKENIHYYSVKNYYDFYYLSKEELLSRLKSCFCGTKNFFKNIKWNYTTEIKKRKEKELKRKIEQLENDFNDELSKN